jgi:hypothetical protein
MIDYLTLVLPLVPSILLVAGACAVAVWAARLPDQQSSLVARLTGEKGRPGTGSYPSDKPE